MNSTSPMIKPKYDPGFQPAVLHIRDFEITAKAHPQGRRVDLALFSGSGRITRHKTHLFPETASYRAANFRHLERLVKFLLWQRGGYRLLVAGAVDMAQALATCYQPAGARKFDCHFMGPTVYGEPFSVHACGRAELPETREADSHLGRYLNGCRIGFDLGGSDRKCAAVIDGEVVFSEEIPWSPYFEEDPDYHRNGILHSLERAAAKLPRVDAIGGSAAGIYIDNQVRVASLFRGVSKENFDRRVRHLFTDIAGNWEQAPFEIANDGEVTALAGSMWLKKNSVLGISMGTSQAAGYVTPQGGITSWLNELAFAPVDYRQDAPLDEWSGDRGCGVQYFSQQAVARLAKTAGIHFDETVGLPQRLEQVQAMAEANRPEALAIFETIGCYLGYSLVHYAQFYDFEYVLLLGRVTSGKGGERIRQSAEEVLKQVFPEWHERLHLVMPDETMKRHGQAVTAASLPKWNT